MFRKLSKRDVEKNVNYNKKPQIRTNIWELQFRKKNVLYHLKIKKQVKLLWMMWWFHRLLKHFVPINWATANYVSCARILRSQSLIQSSHLTKDEHQSAEIKQPTHDSGFVFPSAHTSAASDSQQYHSLCCLMFPEKLTFIAQPVAIILRLGYLHQN